MSRLPLGAHAADGGVHFSLFSSRADAVELCLFDADGRETERLPAGRRDGDRWHWFQPGCGPGQRYGYRVHGDWAPEAGLRFNPAKLLLDPYARALDGAFVHDPSLYDYLPQRPEWKINLADSADCVPKCVVTPPGAPAPIARPARPWGETVIYEANVRGFTMRAPGLSEAERGRFRGLANDAILGHLKALGITAVELMPVHALLDEPALVEAGRRNLWGYNSIGFFTADARFALADANAEFVEMVNAIHDAGLEVILDVVYNHTAEGGARGPCLSFRGIDNPAYYRAEAGDPGACVNDSGCGNTINADHRRVQDLVLDSLVHWHRVMGVDGFRFDLATILGRSERGFDPAHPLLARIVTAPGLAAAKLIAEPWDPGPGGYALGRFPGHFAELNDRFRDTVRRFWSGEGGQMAELARRLHGSADLFEASGRPPTASVNFVTNHDGPTLADLVAAGGPDPRGRRRLALLATLLFAQGTPLLLAGDEMGNSQGGNTNAYDQDNETGWTDWSGLASDPEFTQSLRDLLALRRRLPLLRRESYVHDTERIAWLRPDGERKQDGDWHRLQAKMLILADPEDAVTILVNGSEQPVRFCPPEGRWRVAFCSDHEIAHADDRELEMPPLSIALLELVQ